MVGCWRGYLSGARCRLAYGPADATATHCLLLHLNPYWFCLLVPAHPGSPGQRAVKRVCVCVCVRARDNSATADTCCVYMYIQRMQRRCFGVGASQMRRAVDRQSCRVPRRQQKVLRSPVQLDQQIPGTRYFFTSLPPTLNSK